MSAHASYVIVAISNSGHAPETSYRQLQNAAACPSAPYGEMFKLEVPSLMVGTLDSLMNLSDDLGKTNSVIESIVRKVEKTATELAGKKATELTVGGVPSTRYVQQFAWDYAKFPNRRPLKELVSLIAGGVTAIDEELKQLSTSYGDKQVALQDARRKKGGNLMTVDLNDVLDDKIVGGLSIHDTEYLKTVFVAVPKSQREAFEKEIYNIGGELVGYGGEYGECRHARAPSMLSSSHHDLGVCVSVLPETKICKDLIGLAIPPDLENPKTSALRWTDT
jgi:V-type H+-transporting ATPase subunit C